MGFRLRLGLALQGVGRRAESECPEACKGAQRVHRERRFAAGRAAPHLAWRPDDDLLLHLRALLVPS
jgi:hypothetical protein